MKNFKDKVCKRRINWVNVIYYLHRREISEAYTLFKVKHLKMSSNRCAYYVLKTYYSTTMLKAWRECYEKYGLTYESIFDLKGVTVYELL